MKTIKVTDPKQLDVLLGQKAQNGNLSFSFSKTYLSELKKNLSNPYAYQIIIKDCSSFVGYVASAETLWKDHLTIVELFISLNYQNRGIGKDLVSKIINHAKEEKLKGVVVQTEKDNLTAQKFYEKIGFRKFKNPEWEGISYKIKF